MTIEQTLRRGNHILATGYSDETLHKKSSTDYVDFDDQGTRIAYLIRYFITHGFVIKHHLSNALGCITLSEGRNIFKDNASMYSWVAKRKITKTIKIVCYGGGPGSDVLGILDFLNDIAVNCQVELSMFDKFVYWEKTLRKMISVLQS